MGNIVNSLCNEVEGNCYIPEATIETEESFIQFETYKLLHDSSYCHFQQRINDKSYIEWHEKPSRSKEDIKEFYCTIKEIGAGFYGRVNIAYLKREKYEDPQQSLRVKVLNENAMAKYNIGKPAKKRLFAIKNINKEKHKGKLGLL